MSCPKLGNVAQLAPFVIKTPFMYMRKVLLYKMLMQVKCNAKCVHKTITKLMAGAKRTLLDGKKQTSF